MTTLKDIQTSNTKNSEVDLSELIITIWNGKKLIIFFIAVALLTSTSYIFYSSNKFTVSLDIQPLQSLPFDEYKQLNSKEFFNISRPDLLTLLSERLLERTDLIDNIKEHNLVDRSKFTTDESYNKQVIRKAHEFKISSPTIANDVKTHKTDLTEKYWTISYSGSDIERTLLVIQNTLDTSTENTRQALINRFNRKLELSNQNKQYSLEDIDRDIKNIKSDYNTETGNRLEFLKEQAEIARSLNIKKNAIEALSLSAESPVLTNAKTNSPFYLRGYIAIEKEISLLNERKSNTPFISDLLSLTQKRRDIVESKEQERALKAFNSSPIVSAEEFKAAKYDISSAKINYQTQPIFLLIVSTILGGTLGLIALFIKNILRTADD